jgi:hypothetical protein
MAAPVIAALKSRKGQRLGKFLKTSVPLTSSHFLLRFAGETQSSQLLSAVENPLLRSVIICGRFGSISFSTLARLEDPLSAGSIYVLVFSHAHKRRSASKVPIIALRI